MGAILLVVGNSAAPTTGDALLKTLLESQSHTVTYISDETTEDITGMDGVVISESCASGTVAAKYTTVAIPVVSFEDGDWDELQMTTAAVTLSVDALDVSDATHAIADGPHGTFTGTVTIYSPTVANAVKRTSNTDASGAVRVLSSGSIAVLLAAESGATLLTGTAPARRVIFGIRDAGMSSGSTTADLQNLIKNAFAWSFASGSTDFPLDAQPGSYAVAGADAGLEHVHQDAAETLRVGRSNLRLA